MSRRPVQTSCVGLLREAASLCYFARHRTSLATRLPRWLAKAPAYDLVIRQFGSPSSCYSALFHIALGVVTSSILLIITSSHSADFPLINKQIALAGSLDYLTSLF